MLKKTTILAFFTVVTLVTFAQPAIQLENFATGLSAPVDIVHAGDERLFVVERYGYIKIVQPDGSVNPVNFLDIHTQVESGYQEQGLLGLAFHPNYAENGYFFVHYNDLDGNTVIARFTVSTFDPDVADPTTELEVFTADQPFVNHNGGCLRFGHDGYLYIGLGDGGSAGDPGDRAQNLKIN
jgi:glucose/arabinose dehydrogenase